MQNTFLCILLIWNILKKIIQNPTKILIKDGGFVAHRSSSQKFNAVALNRLSVNREGKKSGWRYQPYFAKKCNDTAAFQKTCNCRVWEWFQAAHHWPQWQRDKTQGTWERKDGIGLCRCQEGGGCAHEKSESFWPCHCSTWSYQYEHKKHSFTWSS